MQECRPNNIKKLSIVLVKIYQKNKTRKFYLLYYKVPENEFYHRRKKII